MAFSIGIASAWLKERDVSKAWKAFVVLAVILICLSTMFIKQHSALDFFAALPVCLLAEVIAYGKTTGNKRQKVHGSERGTHKPDGVGRVGKDRSTE